MRKLFALILAAILLLSVVPVYSETVVTLWTIAVEGGRQSCRVSQCDCGI